jgi:hypothetical protein
MAIGSETSDPSVDTVMLTDQLLGRCHSSLKHLILEIYPLESVLKTAVRPSRDIDVRPDTTVRLRSTVVQHGRTMALIRGVMESVDGKTIYAVCDHHKVNVPTLPEHIDLRGEMEQHREEAKGRVKAKL